MKPGHTIAGLFVAWLLMVPPQTPPRFIAEREPNFQAPMSKWENFGEFADARACERERTNLANMLADPKVMAQQEQTAQWYPDYARKRLAYSKCIEADDPRLTAK